MTSHVMMTVGFVLLLDAVLCYHAYRHVRRYRAAREWPQVEANLEKATVERVVYTRRSSPMDQQYYEVTLDYRYAFGGQEYSKRWVRRVSSKAEAEQLEQSGSATFWVNPERASEVLETLPARKPGMVLFALLLWVNLVGGWMVFRSVSATGGEF